MKWANSIYVGIVFALAGISIALLVVVTGWISIEVASRVFGMGIMPGSVEFTEYALFNMTFLAAPWILHCNAHVRVLIVSDQLPAKARLVVTRGVHFFSALVCSFLLYYAVLNLKTSLEREELIFGELVFPEWYLQWQVPLSLGLLAIGFLKACFTDMHRPDSPEAFQE